MLIAILLFVVLASLFVIGTVLNAKTPKPEGCEDVDAACEGCNITSCLKNPKLKEEIKK